MKKEEKELVEKILKGDKKALRRFYSQYYPHLLNFIQQRIVDPKDAEETLQDTFLASLEAFRNFSFKCSLFTFLCSIAKRKTVDFYRKKKLKVLLFSHLPESFVPLFSNILNPEEELDEKILKQKVKKTLSHLRPIYKKVLVLKYFEGLKVIQIAQKLSVSEKSAESTLFRARRAFASVFVNL